MLVFGVDLFIEAGYTAVVFRVCGERTGVSSAMDQTSVSVKADHNRSGG